MQLGSFMFRKRTYIAIAVAIMLILTLSLKLYYVRSQSWGWLFWNNQTAFVFIGEDDQGYRFSCLGYGLERIRDVFPFGGSAPVAHHASATVLQATPNSVKSYSVDDFRLGVVEPFRGMLYVPNMLPGGKMMKWAGTHFVPVTTAELQDLHKYLIGPNGPPAGPSYNQIEGWSKRTIAGEVVDGSPATSVEKDSNVTIRLDGQELTFVMNSGFVRKQAYIDVTTNGHSRRIWQLDGRPHRVSKLEFRELFAKKEAVPWLRQSVQ
jgi:hypothetical protein